MSSPITILRAAEEHLKAIVHIEQACFDDDAFSRRQLAYLVSKAQGCCHVALLEGQVAGYISLLMRRGCRNLRIYSVGVAPWARGRGVGAALLTEAITQAQWLGLHELTLEVRTDNAPALALYTHKGFKTDRLLKNYYHDGTDAWRMRLAVKGIQNSEFKIHN